MRDTADETQKQLDGIDGDWWDSQRRVPEKFLVLKRDDATGTQLSPTGFQRVGITCA
ncbi:DUF4056 domain-containing protein [Serratia sp. L9]|uniref:DUF4056 domain-containing protein n=1 Tax=Serratia sp. L9 TaxID=3423946 RepID=UPI003D66E6ED